MVMDHDNRQREQKDALSLGMIWRIWGKLLAGMEEAVGSRGGVGRSSLALIEARHRATFVGPERGLFRDPQKIAAERVVDRSTSKEIWDKPVGCSPLSSGYATPSVSVCVYRRATISHH